MFDVTIVGDINLSGDFQRHVGGPESALNALTILKQETANKELVLGNLEGPITDKKPYKDKGKHVGNPEWSVEVLKNLNFNVLSLANNHIMDFGEEALQITFDRCRDNVKTIGAGMTLKEAMRPAVLYNDGGESLCVLGLVDRWRGGESIVATETTPGCITLYEQGVIELTKECVNKYDSVVVYVHWGLKELYHPKPEHRVFAHKLAKMGVSLVVGSHCHYIQGYEIVEDTLIAYGLGDFIFPRIEGDGFVRIPREEQRYSLLLNAQIDGRKVIKYEFVPWKFSDTDGLKKLSNSEALKLLKIQSKLSKGFNSKDYSCWFDLYNSRAPKSIFSKVKRKMGQFF